MIFTNTCKNTIRLALLLRSLDIKAIPLHGQMSQNKRTSALNKFRSKEKTVLISTDVASRYDFHVRTFFLKCCTLLKFLLFFRGLDIPHVDLVINFDIPTKSKEYIHRVGRTARAGRPGTAITFVSQVRVPF